MNRILICAALAALTFACTPIRQATVATDEAINGTLHRDPSFGRVVCNDGPVCAEVELTRVDVLDTDTGPTHIELRSRVGHALAVQVSLERHKKDGARVDQTIFYDVAMAPRQARTIEFPGFRARDGEELIVVIRARSAG